MTHADNMHMPHHINLLASSPDHSQILYRSRGEKTIFLHGCKIKSGSGLGMKLSICYAHNGDHTTGTTLRYRNNFSGARDWKSDQKSSTVFHSFFWCPTNEFIAISAPNIFDISSKALVGKMLLYMCCVCSGSVRVWECEDVGSLQPQATWQAFHTTKCLDSLHHI